MVLVGGREPLPGPAGCFAASVVARLDDDLAITDLPQDGTIAELLAYRDKIVASLSSTATVPQDELDTFGKRLGKVLLNGDIGLLYGEARREGVRINLVINDCLLQRIPWEYLCAPGEQPVPSRQCGIARVVACRRPNVDAHSVQNPGQKVLRVLLAVSREAGDTVVPLDEMTVALRQI